MGSFPGKTVVVTGGSTGIGAAVARAFGELGADVVVHYHSSEQAAEEVAQQVRAAGSKAITARGDARRSDEMRAVVERAVAEFGGIDVLINNAGAMIRRVPVDRIDDAIFDEVVNLNVRSAVAATAAAVPHMRRGGGGSIIFVTSIAARHGGGPGAVLYAGTKGFISTVTHGFAKELAPDRIRVNAVSPGVITTPFHEKYSTPQQLETMRLTIPMARLGSADECVGAFLYLASDRHASYVTGQVIEVNGGQYMP